MSLDSRRLHSRREHDFDAEICRPETTNPADPCESEGEVTTMISLEDCPNETFAKGIAESIVFPPNGALRPKRRWKSFPTDPSMDVVDLETSPIADPDQCIHHYRFKKSGQPHRIYPELVTHVRTSPPEVSAIEMTRQIVDLVRSFSFR